MTELKEIERLPTDLLTDKLTEFVASNIPTERYEYTAIEQNGAIVGFRVNCIVQDDFKLEIKND